jgi:hypothetical protein
VLVVVDFTGIDVNILDCANKSALAIVSDQKTIKSQEIEAIIKGMLLYRRVLLFAILHRQMKKHRVFRNW